MAKKITDEHPIWRKTTYQDCVLFAQRNGCSEKDAYAALEEKRLKRIALSNEDPLIYGWEPSIWRVCDALLGLDWLLEDMGYGADYGRQMRSALSFDEAIDVLLINGGNRGGKSEYAAKRIMMCMMKFYGVKVWTFHESLSMSIQYQQPLLRKYMPKSLRDAGDIRSATAYVTWKAKTGFGESSFILPNMSSCECRCYTQDKKNIEGGELGAPNRDRCLGFWCDELVPAEWIETLEFRLATRAGCGVITFTPIEGYTDAVRIFQDGATTVKEQKAYLMPRDGLEWDVDKALEMTNCDAWKDLTGCAA